MFDVNQITSTLRGMGDRALQQYAAMNKGDPYILSLAVSESNQRKQLRAAAQAQGAGQQMPKVVDQDIAAMAPQQLPENQGIAQIPAPNMQHMADGGIAGFDESTNSPMSRENLDNMGKTDGMFNYAQDGGSVMRMAGGGMPGYAKGDAIKVYEDRIRAEALRQGVDPDLAVRMFAQESRGDKNAMSPKGAAGLGQLMIPAAKEMGLSPAERFDPEKNIPASVGYLKKQLTKYEGDPEKALAAYNWGGGNVDKHLAKNEGRLNKVGLPKETADYLTKILPIGSARAENVPQATPQDLASQIPGQRAQAPASNYDQTNSYFGQLADKMGIPQEYQRNIANTLNATSGFTSPISMVNRGVGTASRALEATPEMIAKAQQAKQVAETPRLLPPAKAGLEALDAASQEARAGAEATRRARAVAQDVDAAKAAEQSVDAANMTSKIARTTEEAVAAGPNARALDAAKLANASKGLSATQIAEQQLSGSNKPTVPQLGMEPVRPDEFGTAEDKKAVVEAAKEATPAKERKGFDNEDLLTLGLSLLANKSPNFMTALGEAGIQTLGAKREREKGETEKQYREALIEQAKRPASEVQLIEKYQSDPKFAAAYDKFAASKREPMTREKLLSNWSTSPYLQMQYTKPEDYIKMMESASSGGASGSQLNASDQSLIQKYLR